MRSVGREHPLFLARGEGGWVWDADGNRYVDWVMSWGPLIAGHAHPAVVEAVREAAGRGTTFGAPTEIEVELARAVVEAVPSVEQVRFVSSGTEAAMSALRLARAFTGRDRILKFAGGYHGHADALLARAGSGLATLGIPSSPGVPDAVVADTLVAEYNDLDAVRALAEQPRRPARGHHRRAGGGQHGRRRAAPGVPRGPAHHLQRDRRPPHRRRGHHGLPGRLRRRPGAARRPARPDVPGQDRRRRPARRRVRRPDRRHGAPGAGRRRLPGGHALGEPARDGRRASPRWRSCASPAPTSGSSAPAPRSRRPSRGRASP